MHVVEHSILGQMVPDNWGGHVTLRRFPYLPEFARSDDDFAAKDEARIRDWQRHIPILARRAREFALRGGLHRVGVFEVYVNFDKGERPSNAQEAAIRAFVAEEERICHNLVDAMLRFYRAAPRAVPHFFDPRGGLVFPVDPDAAALATVLQFDCLIVPRAAVSATAPLIFSWRPAWDEEHGLQSLVHAGEVLAIGTDEVDDMQSWPSDDCFNLIWNRAIMTPDEVAAYEAYCRDHPATQGHGA